MVITARAIGVLEELAMNPNHGGAKGLSARLGEGRDAIQSAISDLKKLGMLEVTVQRMSNGKIVSTLKVTDTGNQFLITRIHILQSQLNPNSNLILDINTDLLSYKPNSKAEEKMEYEDTPMYIDPEDMDAFREKQRARKHKDKLEVHEARSVERMKHRDQAVPDKWSVTDSTFEFAERMHNLWHVEPWKVTRSRFRFAFNDKRNEYGTNGATERLMMEKFFSKIKHDMRINNPELIWKRFIVEFGDLLTQVNRDTVTPEQFEAEVARSQKSRSKLRVQD
jgi:hypothetical protein